MTIKTQFNYEGKKYSVEYKEEDPNLSMEGRVLDGVHAYCFYESKLVVVYNKAKNIWTPPGGAVEKEETWQEASIREIKEETNMKTLHLECIGYQDVDDVGRLIRQVRSFCIVEPYGEFLEDPDADITEIKLIDPKDVKQYFDWGEIGDRIMDEALRFYKQYNQAS